MSYDLDASREQAALAAEEMERIAVALQEIDPEAVRSDYEDSVEISTDALQVEVFANEAAVTVHYWFSGIEADAVLARAFAHARVQVLDDVTEQPERPWWKLRRS